MAKNTDTAGQDLHGETGVTKAHSFQHHVHGVLSIGGLAGFYARECYGRSLLEALSHQNEYAVAGLTVITALAVWYLWTVACNLGGAFRSWLTKRL